MEKNNNIHPAKYKKSSSFMILSPKKARKKLNSTVPYRTDRELSPSVISLFS